MHLASNLTEMDGS